MCNFAESVHLIDIVHLRLKSEIVSRYAVDRENEPRREKTGFLHMRKQRPRSASR